MSSALERRQAPSTGTDSIPQKASSGRGGTFRGNNRGRNQTKHTKAASEIMTKHSPTTETLNPLPIPAKPSVEVIATSARPKERPRRGSRAKAPPHNAQTASKVDNNLSVSSNSSTVPKNSTRRKRQQGTPKSNKAEHPNKVPKDPKGRQTSLDSPTILKDLPPHLAAMTTAKITDDVNALVERVRAGAMERPSTPGSHIDWADEDDSLPDLDDWMKPPSTISSASHLKQSFDNVISPLVMDGLKSLPDDVTDKASKAGEESLPTNSLFPPNPPSSQPSLNNTNAASSKEDPTTNGTVPTVNKEQSSSVSTPAVLSPPDKATCGESVNSSDADLDNGPGLSASIHAPKPDEERVAAISSTTSLPSSLSLSHNRSHTNNGWPAPAMRRVPRSSNNSPLGGSRSSRHSRTQSTPPMRNPPPTVTHRMHASRPIITGDAMSRLAKTIGSTKV